MAYVPRITTEASSISGEDIDAILRARQLRSHYLGTDLFADPAWDMLLQAYGCHLKQVRISVSSLCDASGVPLSTGLRWLAKLQEDRLLEREDDPLDNRRTWVKLSERGTTMLRSYFDETGRGPVRWL